MNNIKKIFRKFDNYTNPNLSLEERFIKHEGERLSREAIVYDILCQDDLSLFDYIKIKTLAPIGNPLSLENNIIELITKFTDNTISDEEIEDLKRFIINNNKMDLVGITYADRNKIHFHLFNKTITAERLSSIYPQIVKDYPEILVDNLRKGSCHSMSLILALCLDDKAKLVTGSVYTTMPSFRFLHSWVEEEEVDGEIYCYDFTLNTALKKDDYYRLFHTKVFEKISHQQLMDDRELFLKLLAKNSIYSKLYLSSREEALNIAKTL